MRPAEGTLSLRHAVALGLVQGPTELLPVSSSAHIALLPWLGGWTYSQLDDELRKSFEVALHTGAALALAVEMREQLWQQTLHANRRTVMVLALSLAPPVLVGFALRERIERLLGGPRSIAFGLALGAVAMAVADRGDAAQDRDCKGAHATDGLVLGLAQATALMPGVSRNGATLTAARARGFGRGAAYALSWAVALPVIFGASALKAGRLGHVPRHARIGLAAGGLSAFFSTLLSARLLAGDRRGDRALWPYSLYRCLLAGLVMTRMRRAR
jgi:undecaprenyl-diphosphatase